MGQSGLLEQIMELVPAIKNDAVGIGSTVILQIITLYNIFFTCVCMYVYLYVRFVFKVIQDPILLFHLSDYETLAKYV